MKYSNYEKEEKGFKPFYLVRDTVEIGIEE